jgi:hypothetical protein
VLEQEAKFIKRNYCKLKDLLAKAQQDSYEEDIPETFLQQLDLGPKRRHVIDNSITLWKIVVRVGLKCGRSSLPLWMACLYTCCTSTYSLDASYNTDMTQLCDQSGVCVSTCKKRYSEIAIVLCNLCKEIPWIGDIRRKDVTLHLNDVIKYAVMTKGDESVCESPEFCPPKFIQNALWYNNRCEKIDKAKERLSRRTPGAVNEGASTMEDTIDEEDVLLQGLLLRGADPSSLISPKLKVLRQLACDERLPEPMPTLCVQRSTIQNGS